MKYISKDYIQCTIKENYHNAVTISDIDVVELNEIVASKENKELEDAIEDYFKI